MSNKSQTELREKILERIDFLSEHWVMGDDRPPFSFGGWRDEVADGLVDIFDKALTDQHNKTLEERKSKLTTTKGKTLVIKMKGKFPKKAWN